MLLMHEERLASDSLQRSYKLRILRQCTNKDTDTDADTERERETMNEMYGLHFNCQVRDLMKSGLIECAIWFGLLFCVGFDTYNTSDKEEKSKECRDGFGVYKKVIEFVGFVFFVALFCLFKESILIDQLSYAFQILDLVQIQAQFIYA